MAQEFVARNGIISKNDTLVQGGLTANTISATTYYNLPSFSGGTVTGPTNFTGNLSATTISATTYYNLPLSATTNTFVTANTFNNATYDLTLTRNDGTSLTSNLGLLSTDVKVSGGTYNINTGVVTFTNTTGGTFQVTGFSSGMTDTFVTGGTYAAGTATFTRSNNASFNVTGFNTGTVTAVNTGNGMNFTNFSTTGTITMGTPSSTTLASTNALTSNSHTHAFAPGGTVSQYITGAGTLVTFPTITNGTVTGSGTDNYIPRFNGTSAIENSTIYDNGTNVGIGTTGPGYRLDIAGNLGSTRYYQKANGVPTSNLGNPTVTEMALFDTQFNNKTEFLDPAYLKFYTSTDGTTWTEYTSFSDSVKREFVGGDGTSGVNIPNLTPYFAVEVESNGYVFLNALYMYWSSNSHSTTVKTQKRRVDNATWYDHTTSTTAVSAWPGHLYMPFDTVPFYPAPSTSTGHYDKIRFIFQPTWASGAYASSAINLYNFQVWGGYPAGKRNVYSTDSLKNITFPANVTTNATLVATSVAIGTTSLNGNKLNIVGGPTNLDQLKYTRAIEVSSTDLNNLIIAGFYDGSNLTNSPTSGWFYITVEKHSNTGSSDWVHQTATSLGSGNVGNIVYTRTKTSGTWTAWKTLTTSSDISGTLNKVAKFTGANSLGDSLIFDNGTNVGIGTTAPQSKLEIEDIDRGTTNLYAAANLVVYTSDAMSADKGGSLSLGGKALSDTKYGFGSIKGAKENSVNGDISGYLSLYTSLSGVGSVERMRITSAGNVGIGTSTPVYKLSVSDTGNTSGIIAELFGGTNYGAALSYSRGGNYSWTTGIGPAGGVPTSFFTISQGGTTPRLVIAHTSGNVGIGTTSPNSKLQISSINSEYLPSTSSFSLRKNEEGYGLFAGVSGSGNGWLQAGTSNDATNYNLILQSRGGNVGVGTTAPLATLHVSGNALISGNLTATTISATTYYNLPLSATTNTFITANTFNNATYDLTLTRNDGTSLTSNLGLLSTDIKVTGGTYNINSGVVTFTNSTGGTFNVTGFSSGMTDTFTTGGTVSSGTATFTKSNGGTYSVTGFNTGTVTNVSALTLGTTGTDLSSTVANGTTTPVITLNVPTASATNRGVLSTTDWTTFNTKQTALNGTGFVKIVGTTISYDNSTYYLASNPSGYTTGSGTANYIPKFTSGTAIGNSLVYDNGTNVGIGTIDPIANLHVSGSSIISGALTVQGNPTSLQYVTIDNDLDLFNSQIETNNYGTYSRLRLFRASGTQIAPTTPSSNTVVGRLEFGAYNSGSTTFIANAKIEASMDATTGIDDLPSRLTFFTTPDGSATMVERMRLNNAGFMRIGGTAMNISDVINIENGSIAFENGHGLKFQNTGGSLYSTIYSSNNNTVIKSLGTGIVFKNLAGNSDLVTVLNDGNVGIGTASPASKLDINDGNVWVRTTSATLRGLQFGFSDPSHGAYRSAVMGGPESYGGTDSGMLTFHTQNGYVVSSIPPERMRITSAGNVGIGITSPAQQLHTSGDAIIRNAYIGYISAFGTNYASFSHTARTGTNDYSILSENDGTTYVNASTGKNIKFRINNIDKAILDSSGNFGIGTTSPQVKLEVRSLENNTVSPVNSVAKFVGNDHGIFIGALAGTPNYGAWLQSMRESDGLVFPLLLNPNGGNVGIGTTNPAEKLEVNGDVKTTNALLSNQQNTSIGVGTSTVFTKAVGSYTAAFFDYVVTSGANARAGTVFMVINGSSVEFAETETNSIGSTTALTLLPSLSGGNILLQATSTSGTWSVKVLARVL